jgi:hypothetical protein
MRISVALTSDAAWGMVVLTHSVALIVRHNHHRGTRTKVADLIGGPDVDRVSSTIGVVSISRCTQWDCERVACASPKLRAPLK